MSRRASQPKAKKSKSDEPASASGATAPKGSAVAGKRTVLVTPHLFPPGRTCVVYSLTNSPALAYDLALLLDKGFEPAQWTSARLKDEVLYLETARDRYELRVDGSRDGFAVYTLCRVLDPLSLALSPDAVVPVKDAHKQTVAQAVDWADLVWGADSVHITSLDHTVSGLRCLRFERYSNVTYIDAEAPAAPAPGKRSRQ